MELLDERWVDIHGYEGRILSARDHGLLHPCIVDPDRQRRMQNAAQVEVARLRACGDIVGRHRVN